MPLRPGDALERYVVESILGQGGMGVVYLAHDSRLHRRVALKVLHEGSAAVSGDSGSGGGARILREARTAAMLEHPNVVATYDVGEITEGPHAGTAYLAMEYLDGRALRAYVGDASIPIVTRARWLTGAARGLQAAHERGLVHRDMKPENVIVRVDGTVKVLDFGIAKQSFGASESGSEAIGALRTLTGEGLVVGTPLYMAPEQMRGSPIDAKADQFAWGVMAYELLSGVLPWGTKLDAISLVAAVLTDVPPDPRDKNPAIPPWLALIVLRALAKSPGDRFPTMRDVVSALDASDAPAVLHEPPTDGTALGVTKREGVPRQHPKKRVSRAAALALGAVALAAVAAVGMARARWVHGGSSVPSATRTTTHPEGPRCTNNAACSAALGTPAICRAGEGCVALASADCRPLADSVALDAEDTLWLGGLYATTGKGASWGEINEHGAELARQDFANALGALKASGRRVRPIGIVSCDSVADVKRAASHLVDDLRVPAIIDSQNSVPLIDLVSTFLAPHQTLTIASSAQNPLVTQIPRPPGSPSLVWRTANDASENALAVSKLVESQLEPTLRANGVKRTRVAVLRLGDPTALSVTERFFRALRFNGKSALDNGDDYREIVIDAHGKDDAAYAPDVERLRAFEPNVVFVQGNPAYLHVIGPFERSWRGAAPRPFYLQTTPFDPGVLRMIGTDAGWRRRVLGADPSSTTSVNALFTMHLNEVFKTDQPRHHASGSDYDAFYVLAYASFALGDKPPTGPNLAEAISRLVPPGPTVDVGPSGIFQAFTRLSAGESIDLNGAGGNLDFDVATGEHLVDLAITCIAPDENGVAHESVESGLVYVARTGELVGQMRCP